MISSIILEKKKNEGLGSMPVDISKIFKKLKKKSLKKFQKKQKKRKKFKKIQKNFEKI